MILSGLRVFDIRDPQRPRETAYYNAPIPPRSTPGFEASNWAMASPSFVPDRREIRYSDGYSGFYSVRVTNGAWTSAEGQGQKSPSEDPATKGGDSGEEKRAAPVAAEAEGSARPQTAGTASAESGALPFSGLELGAIALGGLLAIMVGLGLRRRLGHAK